MAASGAFWLWIAGLHITFVRNGFERVSMLVHTGTVDRLDVRLRFSMTIESMRRGGAGARA